MSGVHFKFEGLEELKAALRALPENLAGEAGKIIEGAGNRAALDLKRAYPVVTGHLRDGVEVTHERSGVSARAVVRSRAPHAWLYEHGVAGRKVGKGLNRTPTFVFAKTMSRVRREMYDALQALLERYGLRVTGRAA
jgi:hypothetical protein